tara:strand:+ start:1481 stop:1669 length:189 start_codon:yes stop_codon:yes gene_type:complete
MKIQIGDLVMVVRPETTGYEEGEIGIVLSVERIGIKHLVYWVLFGKDKSSVPMWDVEIKKLA